MSSAILMVSPAVADGLCLKPRPEYRFFVYPWLFFVPKELNHKGTEDTEKQIYRLLKRSAADRCQVNVLFILG
jgi:hypothetical protein